MGIAKYVLKLYEINRFGRSGSGTGAAPFLHFAVYTTTSPLLTGTRLPDPSTQSQTFGHEYGVVVADIRESRSQPEPAIQLSIVSLDVGVDVQMPILPHVL